MWWACLDTHLWALASWSDHRELLSRSGQPIAYPHHTLGIACAFPAGTTFPVGSLTRYRECVASTTRPISHPRVSRGIGLHNTSHCAGSSSHRFNVPYSVHNSHPAMPGKRFPLVIPEYGFPAHSRIPYTIGIPTGVAFVCHIRASLCGQLRGLYTQVSALRLRATAVATGRSWNSSLRSTAVTLLCHPINGSVQVVTRVPALRCYHGCQRQP